MAVSSCLASASGLVVSRGGNGFLARGKINRTQTKKPVESQDSGWVFLKGTADTSLDRWSFYTRINATERGWGKALFLPFLLLFLLVL